MSDVVRAMRAADEAASVAHDFIHGKNRVTKKQASDAIWRIHDALRPYIADVPEDARAFAASLHRPEKRDG